MKVNYAFIKLLVGVSIVEIDLKFKYLKIPESNYFWKRGTTNKSTGNQIKNKFSYNSNAIRGKMRL